eukprot:gene20755-24874_t
MAEEHDESAKLADIARALQVVLTCRSHHVRGAAIRALIWLRTPTFLPGLMSALGEQFRDPLWPVEPLECIMETLCTRMQGDPDLTTEMLQGVRLLVEAAPARVNPEIVLGVWKASLAANGPDNLHLTLIGVHEMLGMLHTLRPVSRSPIDTDLQVVAAVHQHIRMARGATKPHTVHGAQLADRWITPAAIGGAEEQVHAMHAAEQPAEAMDGAAIVETRMGSSSLLASAATRNPLMAQAIAELQRGINELSLRDRTPPRLPENLFHDIGKDQCISRLDLRSGFHQILLTEDASRKTCFWWAREGAAPEQYVYKRMPFGCTNSTAMFCRVIEHELRGFRCAKVYCDDILITSPTARDHIKDVADVIERLNKEDYSTLAWPLNCLLRKGNENIKELWSREHGEAFAKLKERLTEPGVVVHAYDPSKLLYLMMD